MPSPFPLRLLASLALCAGVLAGCAAQDASTEEMFMEDMRDAGFRIEAQSAMQQPFFTNNPGMVYLIDGEQVQVFAFVDNEASLEAARQIESDASQVGTIVLTWQGSARFYRKNELIALYVGTNAEILAALEDSLGEPIASTEAE